MSLQEKIAAQRVRVEEFKRQHPIPPAPARRPEAIALEELVNAIEDYLSGDAPAISDARLTLALNAARNALQMGRVLDGIAADPDIVRGHVGSVG